MTASNYDRALVGLLVPTIWDRAFAWGMVDEFRPDPDMPKGTVIKKRGCTLYAHLADIRRAYERAPLSRDDAAALVLVGGMGMTYRLAAFFEGTSHTTMQRRYERGVGVLVAQLNGNDYTEGDLDENQGDTDH